VVNGGFETNSLLDGTHGDVAALPGWTSPTGGFQVWRNVAGRPAGEGTSMIAIDAAGRGNSVEQTVATVAGRTYTLSFLQSPAPGVATNSNKFTVQWNGANLGTVARNGKGLATMSWQPSTFTVVATGNDRITFRENDNDGVGAFIDDVRVLVR